MLGILLHEAAHGLAHARKVSDTSRQGRSRNALACSCACGRRIRMARSVLEACPDPVRRLRQPFEPEDDGTG